jgi:uncharacterized repeat protein (TIGR03843 family)
MTHPALCAELTSGELELSGRLMEASNATFLGRLIGPGTSIECVYKPTKGERPLWDFPRGTLGLREVAAYELSKAAGFDVVPVTALVDGPFGPGSLQVWVDTATADNEELVDLVPSDEPLREGWFRVVDGLDAAERSVSVLHADVPALRRLAVFDCVINNADRKGGHILASEGRVFGCDHGIGFHPEPKLRTLLWGWAGSQLSDEERDLVAAARDRARDTLSALLAGDEIAAVRRRCNALLRSGRMPTPNGEWPAIPWPPF